VHSLLAAGHSERAAAQILSLSRGTVHRYAAAATVGELLVKATSRPSKLDRYKPYLRKRWNEGITSAAALHAELQAKGWQGSVQAVERYVRPFRAMTAAPPPGPVIPATRQITRWLLTRPAALGADEQKQLAVVLDRCPHLDALAGHVRSFAEMMARRQGEQQLEQWLTAVEDSGQPELRSFANGIRRDQDAVTNGLTLPYSSAAVEGTVTKIKMLKRQMYGRASFGLLPQARHPPPRITPITESAPEPAKWARTSIQLPTTWPTQSSSQPGHRAGSWPFQRLRQERHCSLGAHQAEPELLRSRG
jgi:hypothetical protein